MAALLNLLASLFPLRVVNRSGLALFHPPLITWFDSTAIACGAGGDHDRDEPDAQLRRLSPRGAPDAAGGDRRCRAPDRARLTEGSIEQGEPACSKMMLEGIVNFSWFVPVTIFYTL